ncbi:IclR family transcriptional regulator C-terminal domain-containing protein [Uliginosibacterium sp. sgz301328]|uniref:IclR family transcriptional regulator domain-containing protein n=1 Tax=Uliginosibacterium sp. sgz301328 TaxID=3243764 RepID=UPI00359D7A96
MEETETGAAAAPEVVSRAAALNAFAGDPNFMMSLARGLLVISAFGQQKRGLSVAQLALRTGLSRAAVRRCVYTLQQLGFASSDDERHFVLTPKTLALGHAYLSSSPLATLAAPILERISAQLHESCSVATLEGEEIFYVARSKTTSRIMSVDLSVGSRLPAYCTSMGRVLLAALSPAQLDAFLGRAKLIKRTAYTVADADALRAVLRQVGTEGYALIDQELEVGLRSIAVPIFNPQHKVIAALNLGTHSSRISVPDMQKRVLPVLRAAADELGLLLPA